MADRKAIARAVGDYARGVFIEDGRVVRHERQELGPAMRRVEFLEQANKADGGGKMGRRYIGTIPMVLLTDWLKARGYTWDQFARNEGGSRCPAGMDPVAHATLDGGVKSEFLRFFLTRDHAKLHTQHLTTKRERAAWSGIELGGKNAQFGGVEGSDRGVDQPARPDSADSGVHSASGS